MAKSGGIFSGFWYDYSTNAWILTLRGQSAALLQAAIPIFATFVGSAAWSIVQSILYHCYFTPAYRNEVLPTLHFLPPLERFREQRRILLRNSSGGFGTFLDMYRLMKQWRNKVQGQVPSLVVIMSIGFSQWAGWIIIGVTVSFLWTSPPVTHVALMQSGICGFPNISSVMEQEAYNLKQTLAAEMYVKQCYEPDSPPALRCSYFPQLQISSKSSNVDCPFRSDDDKICLDKIAFQLDTGLIDSHEQLGINAPKQDRVALRKVTTCSPVSSKGHRSQIIQANETEESTLWSPDTTLYRFFFGPTATSNWTFEFSSWSPSTGTSYALTALQYYPSFSGPEATSWQPDSGLYDASLGSADMSLLFLNGLHVSYFHETLDPFFLTGAGYSVSSNEITLGTLWKPAYYTNVLSCIDQFQLCQVDTETSEDCTSLGGAFELQERLSLLDLNAAQRATAARLSQIAPSLTIAASVAGRGGAALLASETLSNNLQFAELPLGQWSLEVSHWHSLSLAKLQQSVMDFAAPAPGDGWTIVAPPRKSAMSAQCGSQLTSQTTNYSNFSCLGIAIIATVGTAILIIGQYIDTAMEGLLRLWRQDKQCKQWENDGPLQLQAQMHKAMNYGAFHRVTQAAIALGSSVPRPATRLRKPAANVAPSRDSSSLASSRRNSSAVPLTTASAANLRQTVPVRNTDAQAAHPTQLSVDTLVEADRSRATSAPPDLSVDHSI